MITSLTNLFITISDLEQTSSEWQKGIIIPIHKSASIYDLNNYRGITLTSNILETRLEFRQDQPLCQISMKLELVERYRLVYSEKTYFLSEFYRFVLEK
jgi:hypothetical protein